MIAKSAPSSFLDSARGFLAFNQAALGPSRVERIVAISPPGVFVSLLPMTLRFLRHALLAALRRMIGTAPKKRTIADFLAPGATFRPQDADWLAFTEQFVNRGIRMNAAMPKVFPDRELRGIEVPALLLIAERETMYDAARTLRIAMQRMPGLQAAIVPGAHHLAALAEPELVNDAIVRFLAAAPATEPRER